MSDSVVLVWFSYTTGPRCKLEVAALAIDDAHLKESDRQYIQVLMPFEHVGEGSPELKSAHEYGHDLFYALTAVCNSQLVEDRRDPYDAARCAGMTAYYRGHVRLLSFESLSGLHVVHSATRFRAFN